MRSENPVGADNQQERPGIEQWAVGFVDGERCYSIIIENHRTDNHVQPLLRFSVKRRSDLVAKVVPFFEEVHWSPRNSSTSIDLPVSSDTWREAGI